MKSALVRGKIVPPKDTRRARERLGQLRTEIAKVDAQINDPGRILKYVTSSDYDLWHASARRARRDFRAEAEQLAAWIAERDRETAERGRALLARLLDEVDLDEEESEMLDRLEEFLRAHVERPAEARRVTA